MAKKSMNSGVTVELLESALTKEDWDPEYCLDGELFGGMDYFEIHVGERTLFLEIASEEIDGTLPILRICEHDENEIDFVDIWDLEEMENTAEVIKEIFNFLQEV